jgi:hypothetical protein
MPIGSEIKLKHYRVIDYLEGRSALKILLSCPNLVRIFCDIRLAKADSVGHLAVTCQKAERHADFLPEHYTDNKVFVSLQS